MKRKHVVLAALIVVFATGAGTAVWAYTCSHQICVPNGPFWTFTCQYDYFAETDCQVSLGGSLCSELACAPPTKGGPPDGVWVIDYDDGSCSVWDPYEGAYEYHAYCEVQQVGGPN